MLRRNSLVQLLLWGATLVSFGSTAIGLFAWFRTESGILEAMVFAAIWSGLLQGGIVVFWSYAVRTESWFAATAALLLGLLCTLGSMTFASTVWLMRTGKTEYQASLTRANAETVIGPIADFNKTLHAEAGKMMEVAATADSEARLESSEGGTCEGVKPVNTCGPICRLRQRHQTEAQFHAGELTKLAEDSTRLISSIQADLSRDGLTAGYNKAAELGRSPALAKAKSWLDTEIRGFDSKFLDAQSKASFVCHDAPTRALFADARKVLDTDLSLPRLPPEPATVAYSDAATKSVGDIMHLVKALFSLNFGASTLASLQDNSVGLGIAAFIEIIVVFLVIVETRDLLSREVFETASERFMFTNRKMPKHQLEKLCELGRFVDRFTYRSNSMPEVLFLRPLDGSPETVARCADIVRLFDLPFSKRQIKVVQRDIVEGWAQLNDDVSGGARMFEVRVLTPKLERQLRIVARDALFLPAIGTNDNAGPASSSRALVARTG